MAGADAGEADGVASGEEPGARFERAKQRVGLIAGPVLALLAYLGSSDSAAPALPALMALCVTWWITEALPAAVVALLAACGAVLLGLATPKEAFGAFGSPTLFLFVGSFFIAEAMRIHGLGERLARAMARLARGRLSMLIAMSASAFVMSMFMSNAAATAILLPLALSAAHGAERRYQAALVLAVAWSASVGGLGTPVGTPPNLIGLAELGKRGEPIDFLSWMAIGVPMGALMLVGMVAVLALMFGVRPGQPLPVRPDRGLVPWGRGEVAVLIAFAVAIVGWLGPSVLKAVAPDAAILPWLQVHLTEEVVALIAGCLLFVLPAGTRAAPRPALTWAEGTQIEWGVILLFGGGMMLGELARTTGLAHEWGGALMSATGSSSLWGIVALCTGVAIVLSEATSNTATATLMAPLAGSLAEAAGVPVVPAVLGATLGASFGFMMPISTAPNALAYATGRVRVGEMIRSGVIFDVVGFLLILGALRLMAPVMGWS